MSEIKALSTWEKYDETETYSQFSHKELSKKEMQVIVNDDVSKNYKKIANTLKYYVRTLLSRFFKKGKWTIEFWLKESDERDASSIYQCQAELRRDNGKNIFVKNSGRSLREASKGCLKTLVHQIRREKQSWKRRAAKSTVH